jgi:hypothetical protein
LGLITAVSDPDKRLPLSVVTTWIMAILPDRAYLAVLFCVKVPVQVNLVPLCMTADIV